MLFPLPDAFVQSTNFGWRPKINYLDFRAKVIVICICFGIIFIEICPLLCPLFILEMVFSVDCKLESSVQINIPLLPGFNPEVMN